MNDVTSNPSPRLKVFAALARWALWLLASAWITVGLLWGGLHFVIVPRIGEFRPWLEQQASRTLGATVRIGAIAAKSNGLIPSVELSDVRLLDAQGREALRLPTVLAALSPRSAVGLGFEQLYVEGPQLDIRRTRDGRLWIAGFALPQAQSSDTSGADWVFSQTELAVRHGRIRWIDETRDVPPLELDDVDVVLRNRLRTHSLRFDANPPAGWGQRLTVMGRFKQPLLSRHAGNWREWTGQLFAQSQEIDLARLRNYADLGFELTQGAGSLRAWADVNQARLSGATADVTLQKVTARIATALDALEMAWMSGRLGYKAMDGGVEYTTQDLTFETQDGLRWPGGNVRLSLVDAVASTVPRGSHASAHGELNADRLDLAAMAEIATRLPIPVPLQERLRALKPQGLVERVQLSWQGEPQAPERYSGKGRVSGLNLAANTGAEFSNPGVRGATVEFDLTQSGGKATVGMKSGALDLPEVFDDPELAIDTLGAQVQWKAEGAQLSVDISKLQFANADGQGEAQVHWQSAPLNAKSGQRRGPGMLDLQATLSRMEGTALHRYLPTAMQKEGREYLHAAILGGTAANVKFKVKGDLAKFPFYDAKQGEFRISAGFQNAMFAFAPPLVLPKDSMLWPVLTQASGELLLEYDRLSVKGGKASVAGSPGLLVTKGEAVITKLYDDMVVAVNVDGKGPLAEALGVVNNSPVSVWTGKVLSRASATGAADYKLKLLVPVMNADRSTVQGTIALAGNDVQISPDLPRLTRARGQVGFTESGFNVTGGQARALGGDVRIEGGLSVSGSSAAASAAPAVVTGTAPGRAPVNVLRLQGTVSAEGLRQARELGAVARIGQFANGTAAYNATIGLRSGTPELLITSPLTGMALNLPAPFAKPADAALPFRFETSLVRGTNLPGAKLQEQMVLDVGRLANVQYVRDISGPESRVLRGSIAVGLATDESAPQPAEGVAANVNMAQLDVDAWVNVLSNLGAASGATNGATNTPVNGNAPQAAAAGVGGTGGTVGTGGTGISASAMAYLPNTLAVRAKELTVEGRKINNVVVGGGRDGLVWRANLDANELNGYVEYRQPSGATQGRLFARLAHLTVGPSAAQDMESLLDQQPASIPALDIVVEDLVLRGKKLGRVDVQATNMGSAAREGGREWRLNRLNVAMPEATFTATGNWAQVNAQAGPQTNVTATAPAAPRNPRDRRRTVLNFKLDIADSGELLNRFGMPGVIAKGKGKLEGQVAWLGSPFTVDYPSMGGTMNVNVESGQFLKADPGIAKLFGVLSLQSLPRRLTLDFRDVFTEGFSFDFVRGDVSIEQGIAHTKNLEMRGVNAVVFMDGQADIAKETQNISVVVIPEINAGSASLLASAVNPLIGITTFLAQAILRGPLINANTQQFSIDGTWVDPRVTKVERK